jgi:threonine synthase
MDMRQFFLYMDADTTFPELVTAVAPALMQGELNPFSASRVAESAFHFEPELHRLDNDFSILNLYNGPTGVFKDFGTAFLAAVMEELLKNSGQALILSASRGDTGASIANAFKGRKGMTSVILYPAGPIHGLDPAAFVPNGGNIIPIQIRGTFDDCQHLIGEIINDSAFVERYNVTCANAVNPGLLLPQSLYYLYAFTKIKNSINGDLVFSVPSGNFGNLIAGLYAWKFGMPVSGFIAAMNANNAFGEFIGGGKFVPHKLITTCSPALDVAAPSNYERLVSFYEEAPAVMKSMVYPAAIDDETTLKTMKKAYKKYKVILDSHTAVAFAAAEQHAAKPAYHGQVHTVVLATEHPAKEAELVAETTGCPVEIPERLARLSKKVDPVAVIDPKLDSFEGTIASCF